MNPRKSVSVWLGGCLALLIAAAPAFAQSTGTVTGTVIDAATQQPLAGVAVSVAGTNRGGFTNNDGRYLVIGVPAGSQQVRATLIGYGQRTATVNVTPGETVTQNFELSVSAIALEGVVVSAATGREQRLRELGTKVGTIDFSDLEAAPITSLASALSGRTEGVIMQDVSGTTGTSQRIRIRGANSLSLSNEPLIFVDGVQMTASFGGLGVGGQQPSRLNDINPNDIESIEILKGPAASALYGTAAANGVLLITTKRGRAGTTQWNAFVEMGQLDDTSDWPANYHSFQTHDPSAPLFNSNGLFNAHHPDNNPTGYELCPNRAAAAGACQQEETWSFNTMKDSRTTPYTTGTRQRYGMSVRGGTEDVRYFVSGSFEDETGVISFNTQQKANVRANLDARLSPTADISASIGYTDSELRLNNNDNSIFSPIINGLSGRPYFVAPGDHPGDQNPLNYGWQYNTTQLSWLVPTQDIDRYIGSVRLAWRPMSWLSANVTGGLDMTVRHDHETLQRELLPISESYRNGYRVSRRWNDYLYTLQGSAIGTFQVSNDLISTTTVGANYNLDNATSTYCYGSSLVPGTASCATVASLYSVDESFFEVRTVGAYVQQEMNWRDRLIVVAGIRADDNSAFGQNFDLAYYPAASVSWVVGEEEFFPDLSFLSNLRLRAAWGTSGLRPGFRNAVTLYNPTTVAMPGGDVPGISLGVTGNTLLKPERSTEFDLGFDLGLFEDRVGLDFSYFNKESKDALISRRLPGSLGLTTSVLENLGGVRNSGTELSVHVQAIDLPNVGLSLDFTNSTLSNKILAMGEGIEPISFNRGLQRHEEGYSAGGFFQRKVHWEDVDGDGKILYYDTNDDGEIDSSDRSESEVWLGKEEYIGPSIPTWTRTFGANLRLFNWINVATLFEGRGGHYSGNDTESFRCGLRDTWGCAAISDPNASLDDQARYLADRYLGSAYGYIERADFWRWRELSVSLTPPEALTDRLSQLRGMRLTLAGRNLALFTDYSGVDPEAVEGGGASNFSQSEFNTQPPVRYLMIRLDYSF